MFSKFFFALSDIFFSKMKKKKQNRLTKKVFLKRKLIDDCEFRAILFRCSTFSLPYILAGFSVAYCAVFNDLILTSIDLSRLAGKVVGAGYSAAA